MKRLFLAAIVLLSVGSASAAQFKAVCCDGSVHYFHAISVNGWLSYYQLPENKQAEYLQSLGDAACQEVGTCCKSVTQVDPALTTQAADQQQDGTSVTSTEQQTEKHQKA